MLVILAFAVSWLRVQQAGKPPSYARTPDESDFPLFSLVVDLQREVRSLAEGDEVSHGFPSVPLDRVLLQLMSRLLKF